MATSFDCNQPRLQEEKTACFSQVESGSLVFDLLLLREPREYKQREGMVCYPEYYY